MTRIRFEWRTWRNATYFLLVVVAAALVVLWWPKLVMIWREQAWTFLGAVAVMVLATWVQARNFLSFLDTPRQLPIGSFSRLWALGALANYVAPLQPGIAVRVAWLTRHDVSVAESLLATWRQLVTSGWLALAGLAAGLLLTGNPQGRLPSLLLVLLCVALASLRKFWLKWLDRLTHPTWLAQHKHILHRASQHITWRGLVGIAVQYALGTLLIWWVYGRFGAPIGLGQALILTCLVYVSSMVAVLPGNFGVMEAIYMLGGHGFGLSVAASSALAILVRVAHVCASLIIVLVGDLFAHEPRGLRK